MLTGTNVTAGRYRITSITSSTWTVDRNVVTSGTTTNATGKMGGAVASPGLLGGTIVTGNLIYVKYNASAYVISSTSASVTGGRFSTTAGSTADWVGVIGYDSTRTANNTDANRPTIEVAASGVTSITMFTAASTFTNVLFRNLIIDGKVKSSIRGVVGTASSGTVERCLIRNCTNYAAQDCTVIDTEITGCTTTTLGSLHTCTCWGCYCHDNTGGGFYLGNAFWCVADSNTGMGFSSITRANNCVAYNNTTVGVSFSFGRRDSFPVNCICVNNGTYGYDLSNQSDGPAQHCTGYNNTSGLTNPSSFGKDAITKYGWITITGDPFVDAANGDFRLNNTAGAGAALRAAGFPTTFPGSLFTVYGDVGLQHQDSGSGGTVFVPRNAVFGHIYGS